MIDRFRFFLTIGLVLLPVTASHAQDRSPVALINLWFLPACDPITVHRYDFGRPVGSVLQYASYPRDRSCVRYRCMRRGLCVSDFGTYFGGPGTFPVGANARGCLQSICVAYGRR
jgi:hypothetical protein